MIVIVGLLAVAAGLLTLGKARRTKITTHAAACWWKGRANRGRVRSYDDSGRSCTLHVSTHQPPDEGHAVGGSLMLKLREMYIHVLNSFSSCADVKLDRRLLMNRLCRTLGSIVGASLEPGLSTSTSEAPASCRSRVWAIFTHHTDVLVFRQRCRSVKSVLHWFNAA